MEAQSAEDRVVKEHTGDMLKERIAQTQEAILDYVSDGIIAIDPHGLITGCNKSVEQIFAYAAAEMIGQPISLLIADFFSNEPALNGKTCLNSNREVIGLRKNGSTFPLLLVATQIESHDQPIILGILRDLSDQQQVSRMKNEFVSTLNHELRTPLTSITGALGLLNAGILGELPEAAKDLIEIAYTNIQRLNHMISDLLDIEKLMSGDLQLEIKAQSLQTLLVQALQANQASAESYQVQLELAETQQDIHAHVDGQRFLQILTNLLSNAAKFSPPGGKVHIGLAHITPNIARISVHDDGAGIPVDFRPRIFEKFSQADASDTRQHGGVGLGLAIAKQLIECMNGTISFESEPGQGTTFFVDLPISK